MLKPSPLSEVGLRSSTSPEALVLLHASLRWTRMDDIFRIAGEDFPYPVACQVRRFQTARDARHQYETGMLTGERLTTFLACVGLSWWSTGTDAAPEELSGWAHAVTTRGASFGVWLGAARAAAAAARATNKDLSGFADAVRTGRRRSGLIGALENLLDIRNEIAHGSPPASADGWSAVAQRVTDSLASALTEAQFLSAFNLVLAEENSRNRQSDTFITRVSHLMGDNSVWERNHVPRQNGLIDDTIYLLNFLDDGTDLDLTPYCVARACDRCDTVEIYFPDRVRGDKIIMKSFDRGHKEESPDLYAELVGFLELLSLDQGRADPPPDPRARADRAPWGMAQTFPEGSKAKRPPEPRVPSAVSRVIESGVISDGQLLRFNGSAAPHADQGALVEWLTEDPRRGEATWQGRLDAPLIYAIDGAAYSPTGLAKRILRESVGREGPLQGTTFWNDQDGRSIAELAERGSATLEEVAAEIAPNSAIPNSMTTYAAAVDDKNARLVCSWVEVTEEGDTVTITVANGSPEPIYDVRARISSDILSDRGSVDESLGAMFDFLPPETIREAELSNWMFDYEVFSTGVPVTLDFRDPQQVEWRREESGLLHPIDGYPLSALLNDKTQDNPFIW